ARADGQGEQPLPHGAGDLGHRHAHPLRHDEPLAVGRRVDLVLLVLLGHGGPLSVVSWRTPNTYLTAGAGRGPPPQLLRDPGQPLVPEPTFCDPQSGVPRRVRAAQHTHITGTPPSPAGSHVPVFLWHA